MRWVDLCGLELNLEGSLSMRHLGLRWVVRWGGGRPFFGLRRLSSFDTVGGGVLSS